MKILILLFILLGIPVLSVAKHHNKLPTIVMPKCYLSHALMKNQKFYVSVFSKGKKPTVNFTKKTSNDGILTLPGKYHGRTFRLTVSGMPGCFSQKIKRLKSGRVIKMNIQGVDCGFVRSCRTN